MILFFTMHTTKVLFLLLLIIKVISTEGTQTETIEKKERSTETEEKSRTLDNFATPFTTVRKHMKQFRIMYSWHQPEYDLFICFTKFLEDEYPDFYNSITFRNIYSIALYVFQSFTGRRNNYQMQSMISEKITKLEDSNDIKKEEMDTVNVNNIKYPNLRFLYAGPGQITRNGTTMAFLDTFRKHRLVNCCTTYLKRAFLRWVDSTKM